MFRPYFANLCDTTVKACWVSLQVLNKVIEDEPKAPEKRLFDLRIELLQELEWAMWAKQQQRWNVVRFPPSYTLF